MIGNNQSSLIMIESYVRSDLLFGRRHKRVEKRRLQSNEALNHDAAEDVDSLQHSKGILAVLKPLKPLFFFSKSIFSLMHNNAECRP